MNSRDTLLVISTYPNQKSAHTGGGLAIYTKNTLLAIKKANPHKKIVVLANIVDKKENYTEKGIQIIRCWDRSILKLYPALILQLIKHNHSRDIFFGFEFAAYGDLFTTGLLPLFLSFLKIFRKKVTSVIHQVIPNLTELITHTGINKDKNLFIYNQLLSTYFKLLNFASYRVVTLENILAQRFNKIVNDDKAICIPLGLFSKTAINQKIAQNKLNLDTNNLYVLCFGYLSQYKGSDIIVQAFKKPLMVNGKKVRLILAGGESPTQGQKRHYKHFYKDLYKAIDNNSNIIHTGFVPDSRIKTFYSASNLIVFPYRTFMSASGPLLLTIAYKKPFLVSNKLKNYSQNTFKNNSLSIRTAIKKTLSNKNILKQLTQASTKMSIERGFEKQGLIYLNLFK